MKIDPRKADSLSLNRSLTDTVIEVKWRSSIQAQSIENYNFIISRSNIWPMLYYLIRVSFLTTLVIYKTYFKSHHIQIQRPKTIILYVKLLRFYALGICDQVLLDLHHLWIEKLFSQQESFMLLELVTDWRFVQQRKKGYYKIKSNWILEQRFNYKLVFWDRPGQW